MGNEESTPGGEPGQEQGDDTTVQAQSRTVDDTNASRPPRDKYTVCLLIHNMDNNIRQTVRLLRAID